MPMTMVFTNSHTTPLYSTSWTPNSAGSYAGTCIFLIVLASILRCVIAFKSIVEQQWLAKARNRRYVLVKGKTTEAGKIDADPDAKTGSLITAQGVEERVKVIRAANHGAVPFRLSIDLPRALIVLVIAATTYLLMLAVMTMNIGYFFSVLAGTFVGELAVGRYAQWEEHAH